jgi:hypothetical protein
MAYPFELGFSLDSACPLQSSSARTAFDAGSFGFDSAQGTAAVLDRRMLQNPDSCLAGFENQCSQNGNSRFADVDLNPLRHQNSWAPDAESHFLAVPRQPRSMGLKSPDIRADTRYYADMEGDNDMERKREEAARRRQPGQDRFMNARRGIAASSIIRTWTADPNDGDNNIKQMTTNRMFRILSRVQIRSQLVLATKSSERAAWLLMNM